MRGAALALGAGALVVVAGAAWYISRSGSGDGEHADDAQGGTANSGDSAHSDGLHDTNAASPQTPDEKILAELRRELLHAEPVTARSDEERLAEARAWVAANRDPDRPYNEMEAQILALMDVILDGEKRSAEWIMNASQIEIEMVRSIDADGDGQVTEEEVQRFMDEDIASLFDPTNHPYLKDRLDTDGDGEVSPEEMSVIASTMADGALAGAIERARIEAWDTDNDGVVTPDERVLGEKAALERARELMAGPLGENADALFGNPDLSDEELATQRAALVEQIGEEGVRSIEAQRDAMVSQFASQDLLEAMRLDNLPQPDMQEIMDQMPVSPDWGTFDADGDGAMSEEEISAQQDAIAEYQEQMQEWTSEFTARRLKAQFDNSVAQSDLDGDHRLSFDEWEDRIGSLLQERDQRLFLHSYDLDGSGHVDAGEMATYLDWYREGSLRADVTYDGRVDAADLQRMGEKFSGQGG